MSEAIESQTTLKQPNQSTLDAIEDEQAEAMTLEELKAWLLSENPPQPAMKPQSFNKFANC